MQLTARTAERGMALAETVLMMSFISLIMFALVQTGMASFYQVSADGASFTGAHTAVENDPDGSGNGASVAKSVAQSIFQGLGAATVRLFHPNATTTETDIGFASGGLGFDGQYGATTTSREIESSADSSASTSPQFPAQSTECLTNAIVARTGTITARPIYTMPVGTLTTVETSASDSLSGSLSIDPSTIQATFQTTQQAQDAVAAAQLALSANIKAISDDVQAVQDLPVLGTLATVSISGVKIGKYDPSQTVSVGANSLAALVSGTNGDVAAALDGALSSKQVTTLQGFIGSAPSGLTPATGLLGAIAALPLATRLLPQVQDLEARLGAITPGVNALNASETLLNNLDARVANSKACQ